jgi:hypothetical protein
LEMGARGKPSCRPSIQISTANGIGDKMEYYILDTQADFITCEAENFTAHMSVHCDSNGYTAGTLRWADEYQRITDSKYICAVCHHHTNTSGWTIETSDPSWWPVTEI